jgi:hypothetical protein
MATTTFTDYVQDWKNHLKLFAVLAVFVLIGLGIWGFNEIRDLKKELANQAQTAATLEQKFEILPGTTAVIAGNNQATQAQVNQQATTNFGSAVLRQMQQQKATIASLTMLIGQVQAERTAAPATLPSFTPQTETPATGKLTGYTLEQQRSGAPGLSAVRIFYDPTDRDPSKAFSGTTWQSYNEQFKLAVGDWQRQKDGGLRTTAKLSRIVTKPDPNDASKTIQVGIEDIPLADATTIYTPKGIAAPGTFVVPRWTLSVGLSHSKQNGYTPSGTIDYRLFDRYGLYAGAVDGAAVGGVSIRLGPQPKN